MKGADVIRLIPLTAYRMAFDITINVGIGRLVRPNCRVCVSGGKLGTGQPNATIQAIRSTFNNVVVEADVLIDNETDSKTLKLK